MAQPGEATIKVVVNSKPLQEAFDEVLAVLYAFRDELLRLELGRRTMPW